MFKKAIYLSVVFLTSNLHAMYKFQPTIEVVVGKIIYKEIAGELYAQAPTIEYQVMPGSTVLNLKKMLVEKQLLANVGMPLFLGMPVFSVGRYNARILTDNESLEQIAETAKTVSIYLEIYKQ